MIHNHCDHCPGCSVDYESRIGALTDELARLHRQQAELRNENSQLMAALAVNEAAEAAKGENKS